MTKETYLELELEVVKFETEDVITDSCSTNESWCTSVTPGI